MNQDKDLAFLMTCKNDDLRTLCDILTYNNNGEIRYSEQLTNSDAYIKHYPERMNLMATEIGEELRKFGSNTIKTFCRKGEADSYETIVRSYAAKLNLAQRYEFKSVDSIFLCKLLHFNHFRDSFAILSGQ